jgi:shikimate kinase
MNIPSSVVPSAVLDINDVQPSPDLRASRIVNTLDGRPIVLIGMMGAGKTSVGKRLAAKLNLPFSDADAEIELAAKMKVAEIFERHGEPYFRDGERRVVLRMLGEGCRVLATGGGAFMNEQTRESIAQKGVSIWLNADIDVLVRRVRRRTDRPLLLGANLEETMQKLIDQRYPIYAEAMITVVSRDASHEEALNDVIEALEKYLGIEEQQTQ